MKYNLAVLLFLCFINVFPQRNAAVDKFVAKQGFENASIGIYVRDMKGEEIVSFNANQALTPASTLKIVTTAAALEILGEDYRFGTVLSTDDNDSQRLTIHGAGDPTLGSEFIGDADGFLNIWVNKIRENIDTARSIEIKVDDSLFGYSGVSGKWLYEDLGNYYAAGAYGISIFDNMYKVYLNSVGGSTRPEIVKTVPDMSDIVFQNLVTTNDQEKDNVSISGEIFSNRRKLIGNIPTRRKAFTLKGDIPDPGLYLGKVLSDKLQAGNIQVTSISTSRTDINPDFRKKKNIYTHYSPALKDIIRVINVKSNNHYSEHLIRSIGKSDDYMPVYLNPLDEGIARIKKTLSDNEINPKSLFMYDGCGLAPSNKVSPRLLCDILLYMYNKSEHASSFVASFPKAGKEGTVRNLLKDTRLEGKLLVKSGSIADVQCFSGYYLNNRKKYTFSIMVNNYTCSRRDVVKSIEELLLAIF